MKKYLVFAFIFLHIVILKAELHQLITMKGDSIFIVDPISAVKTPFFKITNLPPNTVSGNLSYSPVDDLLYIIVDPTTTPKLASISMNGIYTLIGNITLPGQTVFLIEAMAYHEASNQLYIGCSLNGGVSNNDYYSESILRVNPSNAAATFITTLTNSSFTAPDMDRMCFDGDTLIMVDGDPTSSTTIFSRINMSAPLGALTNTTFVYTNPQLLSGIDLTIFCNDIYFPYNSTTSNFLRRYNYITGLDQVVGVTHPYNQATINRFLGITKVKMPLENNTVKVCQSSYTYNLPTASGLLSYFDIQMNPITSITSTSTEDVEVIVQRFCELDTFIVRIEISLPTPDEIIDTITCPGSFTLQAGGNATDTYVWSTNCTGNSCIVNQAGTYEVDITNIAGCTSKKIFNVSYLTIPDVIIDTIRCPGPITLDAGNALNTYQWSTNCTGNYCIVNQAGMYEVDITNPAGCISKKIFNVTYHTIPDINVSFAIKEICSPTKVVFYNISDISLVDDAFLTFSSGQAFPFVDSVLYETSTSGIITYSVSGISVEGCIIPEVTLGTLNIPQAPIAGFSPSQFDVYMDNSNIHFYDESISAEQYAWFINKTTFSLEQNPQQVFLDTGRYLITQVVYNNLGCSDTISKIVNVKPIFRIYFPNSFTPNENDLNDVFRVQHYGIGLESFELTIYNRWGEVVKSFNGVDDFWDGTYKGSLSPAGIYTYKVECKYKEQRDELKQGMITLIR
jgi:gliding motility-associated-like protein